MLLQYIPDILETPVGGHHDHRISHPDLILSAGRKDRAVPVDAADQKIILQIQIHQRHICHSRSLTDGKLQGLGPAVQDIVQRFHVAADGILAGPHIL